MRVRAASARARALRAPKTIHQPSNDILVDLGDFGQIPGPSSVDLYWWIWEILDKSWWIGEILDKYPALVWYYSGGCCGWGAFLCISYRGKLLQHKSIRLQCTVELTERELAHGARAADARGHS
jgi:hypothetical protein